MQFLTKMQCLLAQAQFQDHFSIHFDALNQLVAIEYRIPHRLYFAHDCDPTKLEAFEEIAFSSATNFIRLQHGPTYVVFTIFQCRIVLRANKPDRIPKSPALDTPPTRGMKMSNKKGEKKEEESQSFLRKYVSTSACYPQQRGEKLVSCSGISSYQSPSCFC